MNAHTIKREKRIRRHTRVRSIVSGTSDRPRLSVFRSGSHMYAQVIDDTKGVTVAAASSIEIKGRAAKTDISREVGKLIAEKALAAKIKAVSFDRGGFRYHGRVKALADAAREAGLEF
jgi:large subunit ribosomal protein L18